MSYVGIDTQGARALGQMLQQTADRVEEVRRSVTSALNLADLASPAPSQLALVHDGFASLAAGVTDKAELAERYVTDPKATAAGLGAPVDALGVAISGLLGFAGPADLRAVLVGLPPPGTDPALDDALARLNPLLLPAFQNGQLPELTEAQAADLRVLALALGIEHAGPPRAPVVGSEDRGNHFFEVLRARSSERTGTEVFWNDFWTGGRTVDTVLADPRLLLEWVAGTFELDRRLALATGLPSLGDVLSSVDFATTGSDPGELAEVLAAAETEFAAIADWLPAFLVGQDRTGPDETQLAQTLAFAARVGWPDPGPGAAGEQDRFADAVAFLRANRALQSALLPTGFEGDPDPLAFFNETGIDFVLDLGRRTGVLDTAVFGAIEGTVDQALASFGVDLSGPAPVALTEQLQQQLFALLATQVPRSALETPAIQAQFIAAMGYLRAAGTGPEQRQRLVEVLAAFRTLVVTGAPALTERQLVAAVGGRVLDVLGRSRLRLRSQDAVRRNPEFLLVARQWGLPGGRKEEIGKYKFSWSFNDLGELTGIKRKKKSWLSRAWDTIKAVGTAIWESWQDNPLKAIFQVGKIALGALAFVVPGFQGLGAAAFAVNLAETAFHAIEGDWLSAIGSGLAAFTAGATDVFRAGVLPTIVDTAQGEFVSSLLDANTLSFLKDAKRVFDIGSSIFRATQADSLVGAIGAGLGAVATTLGSGGQLLRSLNLADGALVRDLTQLGMSVADVTRLVAPAAGLAAGGSVLSAFSNGLALLGAGARVLSNPAGAFAGPQPVAGALFAFDQQTQATLRTLSQGAGAAAGIARAIDAANRGDTFLAGTFLAQAVQAVNDPRTSVLGGRAQAAERIAEIGVLLEAVFERRASPTAVAPLVVQRLTALLDALNTPPPRPVAPATTNRAPTTGTTPAPNRVLRPPPGIVLSSVPGGPVTGTTAFQPTRTVAREAEAFVALGDGSGRFNGSSGAFGDSSAVFNGSSGAFGDSSGSLGTGGGLLGNSGGALGPDVSGVNLTFSDSTFPAPMRLGGPTQVAGPTLQDSPGPETFTDIPGLILTGFSAPGAVQPLIGDVLAPLTAGPDGGAGGDVILAQSTPRAEFLPRPRVTIAVIGNSYTSGEGGDLDTYERVDVPVAGITVSAIHPAHRSSQAAAMQVIEGLRTQYPDVDFDVRFVAVSGATPDDMYGPTHVGTPFEGRPQVDAAGAQVNIRAGDAVSMADIVILGDGGNPRFGNVVRTVVGPGDSYTPELHSELLNGLADGQFRREQMELQSEILSRMNPQGTLLVVGYPRVLPDVVPSLWELYNPFNTAFSFGNAATGSLLSTLEAQMANSFAFEINWQLAGATERSTELWGNRTIHFINPFDAFDGHYLFSQTAAVHGFDYTLATGLSRSFHPTPLGFGLLADTYQPYIARAVQDAIDRQRPPAPPEAPERRGEADQPLLEDGQPDPTRLTGVPEDSTGELVDGLTVPPGITLTTGSYVDGGDSYMDANWAPYLTGNLASLDTTDYLTADPASFGSADYLTGSYLTGSYLNGSSLTGDFEYTMDWSTMDFATDATDFSTDFAMDFTDFSTDFSTDFAMDFTDFSTDFTMDSMDFAMDYSTVDYYSYA